MEVYQYLEDVSFCTKCYEEENEDTNANDDENDDFIDIFNTEKIKKMFSDSNKKMDKYELRHQVIDYSKDEKDLKLIVDGVEIDSIDYDLLRSIVLYYNIPDYDDEYINPELKAELEEVARLKNPNNVQPSLEKQESCIVSTGVYTYETIKDITIRKMVLLLRTIDARLHYFAYRQGELSGMVKFKGELIFLCHAYLVISMYFKLNCLKILKVAKLQHKNEIGLSVKVVEKQKKFAI